MNNSEFINYFKAKEVFNYTLKKYSNEINTLSIFGKYK